MVDEVPVDEGVVLEMTRVQNWASCPRVPAFRTFAVDVRRDDTTAAG